MFPDSSTHEDSRQAARMSCCVLYFNLTEIRADIVAQKAELARLNADRAAGLASAERWVALTWQHRGARAMQLDTVRSQRRQHGLLGRLRSWMQLPETVPSDVSGQDAASTHATGGE